MNIEKLIVHGDDFHCDFEDYQDQDVKICWIDKTCSIEHVIEVIYLDTSIQLILKADEWIGSPPIVHFVDEWICIEKPKKTKI